jgi:NDP-sugar pyrophosphorylase family protein
MAAGIGSRYCGLKQIDPVGPYNEIIIDYSLYDALRAGFGEVVFVINKDIDKAFRERVGRNIESRCKVTYVLQRLENVPAWFTVPDSRKKPWGTAHAVLCCKHAVTSPFAVINADDFYGRSSFQSLYQYLNGAQEHNGSYDFCMIGYVLNKTLTEHGHVARGICTVDQEGFLANIRERIHIERFDQTIRYTEDGESWIEIPGDSVVSMNMWGFSPALFEELDMRFTRFLQENAHIPQNAEFLIPEVVNDLLEEQKATVKVLPTQERWFGVTYRQDKSKVKQAIQELIQDGIYPDNLWE